MNIYTQCCGLVVLLILLFFDLKHKKVGLFTESVYLNTILINAASVMLDVLSVVALSNIDAFGPDATETLCRVHMAMVVVAGFANMAYLISGFYTGRVFALHLARFICMPVAEVIAVFLTPMEYEMGTLGTYASGAATIVTSISVIIYAIGCVTAALKWSRRLGRRRRYSVIAWMFLLIIADILEYTCGSFYVYGFASALGMMIMYFTLENPESNIDKNFGCFNSHVLTSYIAQLMKNHEQFCMMYLSMADAKKSENDNEMLNDKMREIIDFINQYHFAKVFKYVDQEFICIVPNEGSLQRIVTAVRNRFYYDQFSSSDELSISTSKSTTPKSLIVMLTDSTVADNPEDILKVFQTLRETNRDNLASTKINLCKAHFDELREKERIIREIRTALDEDRVEVFYQPIYSTKDRKFISAEALARIRREDNSIVPPGKFIPIAEETGLILKLGDRVFEKTCEFLRTGLPERLGIKYIEVNLSVVQCEQNDLASKYIRIMQENDINPKMINLEITETATIQAKRKLQQNMKQLMEYGVEFSLDDFGNGHSNLDYVIDMPVDIVKLDMSLIQAYENEKKAKAVVQAAVRMIIDMELNALTEGVETKEQLDEMIRIGVSFIQGFYFSKPIPEREFLEFLRKNQGVAG